MDLSIALDDRVKTRNFRLYVGDEVTISLAVYAADGDVDAIDSGDVDNATITTSPVSVTIPVGSQFTVSEDWEPRMKYKLQADIEGVATTLCSGIIEVVGGTGNTRTDYSGAWGCP